MKIIIIKINYDLCFVKGRICSNSTPKICILIKKAPFIHPVYNLYALSNKS